MPSDIAIFRFFGSAIKEAMSNDTWKSRLVVFVYRLSTLSKIRGVSIVGRMLGAVFALLNYGILDLLLGVELKPRLHVGWGLVIYHPRMIVINSDSVIGQNCILRHGVTIGNKTKLKSGYITGCPNVGSGVEFGAYAILIGGVEVADGAVIGAGAYVDFDVPANAVVRSRRGELVGARPNFVRT